MKATELQNQPWTAEWVRETMGHPNYDKAWAIADAHNAALAAERKKLADADVCAMAAVGHLQKQLDAALAKIPKCGSVT